MDKIDTPLESYFISWLDDAFENEDPKEFFNLLEQALESPPPYFISSLKEHKPLELVTSHFQKAYLEEPYSRPTTTSTLLTNEKEKVDFELLSLEGIFDWRKILSMSVESKCSFEHSLRKREKLLRLDFKPLRLSHKKSVLRLLSLRT